MERIADPSFAVVTAPLFATFGDALSFARDGNGVRWSLGEQSATVELGEDGVLDARFFTPPTIDAARGTTATGVYRSSRRGYALTTAGGERMIADTIAFFSGAREPRFVFVDVV